MSMMISDFRLQTERKIEYPPCIPIKKLDPNFVHVLPNPELIKFIQKHPSMTDMRIAYRPNCYTEVVTGKTQDNLNYTITGNVIYINNQNTIAQFISANDFTMTAVDTNNIKPRAIIYNDGSRDDHDTTSIQTMAKLFKYLPNIRNIIFSNLYAVYENGRPAPFTPREITPNEMDEPYIILSIIRKNWTYATHNIYAVNIPNRGSAILAFDPILFNSITLKPKLT